MFEEALGVSLSPQDVDLAAERLRREADAWTLPPTPASARHQAAPADFETMIQRAKASKRESHILQTCRLFSLYDAIQKLKAPGSRHNLSIRYEFRSLL